ncbi:hypothetical protein NMG60_11023448 [Bertholletia excelsa]
MDAYEATRIVLSRIKNMDPENASKIMGLLWIQGYGEKEMIRLAFGPETLVHSVVFKARNELGLSSNSPSTPSTPSSPSPFLTNQSLNSTSSRLPSPLSMPPYSSSSASNSWASLADFQSTDDLMDEFQLQEQLSFLNDTSPALNDGVLFPAYGISHRRSCSVNDISFGGSDDGGFGWRPCVYYARGYCKNGTNCRFLHDSSLDGASPMVGSPSKVEMMEQCQELLRSKSARLQRLLPSSTFPYSALGANKCMNLLLQQQSDSPRTAAALMMGEEVHKFGRSRLERNEFSINGMVNPGSRQIYLTFPADSTFREEDVSNYFSIYGPVQDVRIPYQQKRMFGFVTFVYPETVKLILAKGNPHFVCDARVLVKPYKEKGKVPDKYRKQQQLQQQMERGEYSACGSPTGLDSRDSCDFQLGGRMFYGSQDLLWRRKLEEQADFQQAMELQGQRLMGLQLLDVKRHNHHRTLSMGSAIPSPTFSPNFYTQNLLPSDRGSPEALQDNKSNPSVAVPPPVASDIQSQQNADAAEKEKVKERDKYPTTAKGTDGNGLGNEHKHEERDLPESLVHNLPDSPFASPRAAGDYPTAFSDPPGEPEKSTAALASAKTSLIASSLLPATSTLDMASLNSCYFQVPRFSAGHEAIGM